MSVSMSNYITAAEAAKQWNVSPRLVCRYCTDGRIAGARKYGRSWVLPIGAEKPSDPRGKNGIGARQTAYSSCGMLCSVIPMAAASPGEVPDGLNEEEKAQYGAEIEYMRGNFGAVIEYYYTVSEDSPLYFCAADIAVAAALSTGDHALFKRIVAAAEKVSCSGKPGARYAYDIFTGLISASMNVPEMAPEWLRNDRFEYFTVESRPIQCYQRVKYLQSVRDWNGMLAAAETALIFLADDSGITSTRIYLTSLCACANYALDRTEQAKECLDRTVAMCVPLGFISPLGEYSSCVGGMLEIALKKSPYEFEQAVLSHIERTFRNWVLCHNAFARDNASSILTTREYRLAVLLREGKTYEQAAKQLCLSVGRVRNLISVIYEKLGVSKKSELDMYIS